MRARHWRDIIMNWQPERMRLSCATANVHILPERRQSMPLVRISLRSGRPSGFGKQVGEVVYRAMAVKMNVPAHDHFQVITEHDAESLIYDPVYLDIPRTDGV